MAVGLNSTHHGGYLIEKASGLCWIIAGRRTVCGMQHGTIEAIYDHWRVHFR